MLSLGFKRHSMQIPTVALKALIKYELDINVYNFENWLFSVVGYLEKGLAHFY